MNFQTGWIPPENRSYQVAKSHDEVLATTRIFGATAAPIAGSGEGKTVLLYKYLTELLGRFPVHTQIIGSCVSHGWGLGIDVLKAVEISLKKESEKFNAETATEWIYGTSRVLVGRGQLGNQDGSLGSWAAKAVKEHGTLARLKYDGYDLRQLDEQRAKRWGYRDLPLGLEPIADEHPVKTTSLVTTYEEARDAIANGYPVPVCSMQGFASRRDSDGFAAAQGRWAHCMLFCGVDDEYKRRPGLLCMNSWGPNWIDGPKRHGQPDGSFWVDANVADRMLREKDSYAISNFQGYPRQVDDLLNFDVWSR